MAKQRSGLGRGLNALFDESSNTSSTSTSPVKKEVKEAAAVTQETVTGNVVNSTKEPKTAKPAASSSAPSDIYISEDALENAKVVSREVSTSKQVKSEEVVDKASTVRQATPNTQKPATSATNTTTEKAAPSVDISTTSAKKQGANDIDKEVKSKQETTVSKAPKKPLEEQLKALTKGDVGLVPLTKVQPNPDQPRTNFQQEELEELAASIKKEGLLQPILVRRVGTGYQIIAGERRWQACKLIGMEEIPVRFWAADKDKALELALIENIQRSDLNPIEEAYGYKRLMERKGMTQSEVAKTVSKGRSTIANALRLLELPEDAQQLLFENKITAGHARAILSIQSLEGRKTLTNKLKEEKLSVRETENLARLIEGREKAGSSAAKREPAPASFKKAARGLNQILSTPVKIKTVQGKNKIEIQFKDEAELERIVSIIAGETAS